MAPLARDRSYYNLSVSIVMATSGECIHTCTMRNDAFVANICIPSEFFPFKLMHGVRILVEDDLLEPLALEANVRLFLVRCNIEDYFLARVHIVGLTDIAVRLKKCTLFLPKDNYSFGVILPYLRSRCTTLSHVSPVYHFLKDFFSFKFHHQVRRRKIIKFAKQESIVFNNSVMEFNCVDMFFILNPAGNFDLCMKWEDDIMKYPTQDELRRLDKELARYATPPDR